MLLCICNVLFVVRASRSSRDVRHGSDNVLSTRGTPALCGWTESGPARGLAVPTSTSLGTSGRGAFARLPPGERRAAQTCALRPSAGALRCAALTTGARRRRRRRSRRRHPGRRSRRRSRRARRRRTRRRRRSRRRRRTRRLPGRHNLRGKVQRIREGVETGRG